MYDVVIVGSGIVGLVNALLLAKHTSLRLAVVDAKAPPLNSAKTNDARVYALTPASQRILESLDVWDELVAKDLSPFTHMFVWNENGGELSFAHAALNVPALGYIVAGNLLHTALLKKLTALKIDFLYPVNLITLEEKTECIELTFSKGSDKKTQVLQTALLIGADGAKSFVREAASLPLHVQAYQQSALTAEVQTEKPHAQTAWQVFLSDKIFPKGTLAFLPLTHPHHSSIVWSLAEEEAELLLNLDEKTFNKKLGNAFSLRLGCIQQSAKRQVFPLYERHAKSYVKERIALIGDAAHTIHPLAGQGLNLGIADAASLAKVISEACKKNRDFASHLVLRRYERERRSHNLLMLQAVKLFQVGFSSDNKLLQWLCTQGLNLTNELPWLKNFFAHYAMGSA